MRANSKIFYNDKGKVLNISGEFNGDIVNINVEEELLRLKEIYNTDIYYIELEYGSLEETFNNAKSYYVDIKTKELIVEYYTKEELEKIQQEIEDQEINELEKLQLENEKLIDEIINLKAENLLLKMEE